MAAKRWRWTGLTCIALSALTAALGCIAQVVCLILGIVLFHAAVQVPLAAVSAATGPVVLPIPRILPGALLVAALLLALGLSCLLVSLRRGLARRQTA
jgi:hypothetical protein